MKAEIHPEQHTINATCTCGQKFQVRTVIKDDLQLEVCSNCHPYYTGKQKLVDSSGQVEKFRKKFGKG